MTSRSPSCWPWSTSRGSMPVIRRPAPSMVIPASSSTRRSAQSITFGPSTADERASAAPRSNCSRASGAGSQSSCSSQTHSVRSPGASPAGPGTLVLAARCRSACEMAAPYPVLRSIPNTTERPSNSASTAPLRSRLPVSTATTRCTGRVWPSSASAICGSHAAPS